MSRSADNITVKSQAPLNAGAPAGTLGHQFITPAALFFIRNHGDTPVVDPAAYRLRLDGLVDRPLSLCLAELQTRFPRREVTATLQCAGNRRTELAALKPINGEVAWQLDGISTGCWAGVRLADLLQEVGVLPQAQHVLFDGLDTVEREGQQFGFGGSIPLAKALQAEVLLAYQLNGEPLAADHGYPLRVIVPGYIGARSVKWLGRVRLAEEPSANFFQARAYKIFGPEVSAATADWSQAEALGPVRVNSVITGPAAGTVLAAGRPFLVEGYAVGAENAAVASVELSPDGGQSWQPVELNPAGPSADRASPGTNAKTGSEANSGAGPWAWQQWQASLSLDPGNYTLVVRATDTAGNRQPADLQAVWNFKGYMNNAWHRVEIKVER